MMSILVSVKWYHIVLPSFLKSIFDGYIILSLQIHLFLKISFFCLLAYIISEEKVYEQLFLVLSLLCLFSSYFKTLVYKICSQQFDFDMLLYKYVCMHSCMCVFILLVVQFLGFASLIFIKSERCSDTIFPNIIFCYFHPQSEISVLSMLDNFTKSHR